MKLFCRGGLLHPTLNIGKCLDRILLENKGQVIVNVGCGEHRLASHVANLDLYMGSKVDVMGDGHQLPFQDNSIDGILLLAVLEHVKEPGEVIRESYRALKPGGFVYCEFPFLQPEHSAPSDYWRVTTEGLRHLFREFEELEVGICTGPGSAVAWVLVEYSKVILKRRLLSKAMVLGVSIAVSPLKYLDRFFIERLPSIKVASALYYYGRNGKKSRED